VAFPHEPGQHRVRRHHHGNLRRRHRLDGDSHADTDCGCRDADSQSDSDTDPNSEHAHSNADTISNGERAHSDAHANRHAVGNGEPATVGHARRASAAGRRFHSAEPGGWNRPSDMARRLGPQWAGTPGADRWLDRHNPPGFGSDGHHPKSGGFSALRLLAAHRARRGRSRARAIQPAVCHNRHRRRGQSG